MAYAALLSHAQTTGKITVDQDKYPISQDERQQFTSISESFKLLQEFLDYFPEEGNKLDGRIRDVAREAEDIIESFMVGEAPSNRWAKFKFKRQMKKVRVEIDSITKKVMIMKNESATIKDAVPLGGSSVASSHARLTPTGKMNNVVGLHQDLDEIKDRLCGESSDLQVVPIVGMGGIGKTTLAKYAYDDPLTVERFDIRAWVTVSQSYSADAIFTDLLASMKESYKERSERSNDLPQEKVYRILKGRRYLIVMDDIWSCKAWDDLTNMLPDDANGSRIMLTTRVTDVATYAARQSPLHEISLMDETQSWNLLKQKVFAHQDCSLELENIGKDMATSCKGLPLAIVVVAGLLSAAGNNPTTWRRVAENVNSVGTEAQLEKIMSLSYTHLPHYLRPCFLYMGIFPEDYEIRVSELIKLWAAEGFLRSSQRLVEDEAEECLEDLVRRNLVMVTKRKCDGRIKSCSLHDLMRDLCLRKALEERFLVNFSSGYAKKIRKNQRRLSISTPLSLRHLSKIHGIHTVLCFQGISVAQLLGRFRLLRVLDTGTAHVRLLPDELFDLFHLVYLAIYYLGSIPAAISKLQNLQSLNLCARKFWRLLGVQPVCLPQEIWSMSRLRHLVYHGWFPDPTTNSTLENLQTLSMAPMPYGVCSEKIMKMTPNLEKLEIDCSGGLPNGAFLESLSHLRQLKNLKIRSSFNNAFCGFTFPETLTKLTLICVPLSWDDMTIVGSLPNLQVLKLKQRACIGTTWITGEEEFPQLEFLLIENSGLEQWITESSSHFPRLKFLVLVDLWQLNEIPGEIGEISTLEVIEVKGNAKRSLVESAQRILEEQREYGNDAFQFRYLGVEREMEDATLKFVLNNLKELLVHQSHLITGIRSEIENLERNLLLFSAFLKDSFKKWGKYEYIKALVRNIHDFVYEVEDVIDAFVTRALVKKNNAGISRSFWRGPITPRDIGEKVEYIKQKVEQARADFAGLRVDDEDPSEKPEVRPPRQKDVVGFEDVTKDLITRLTQETEYLDVVSLIGMFGLGKTTLAWKIFNDPAILFQFPIRIWLPISQEFSLKDIYLAILKEFTLITDEIRHAQDHQLAKMVADKLETSSFLMVMDDVWSPADWDRLRDALPDNKNGKVLITSRIEEVGNHASCPRPPLKLRFFDQDESWELLRLETLRTLDCPSEWEELGILIARRCQGLPLAIVVIGGILASKFSASNMKATRIAWARVFRQMGMHIVYEDEPVKRVRQFIWLSYEELPDHLRPCFLYLGMFPEDYEIPSSQLIRMWIGEGFIQQHNDSSSFEEIAEKYLDDLINRNLVKIDKFKPDGKVKTCRIHDELRNLCRTISRNESENFFQEIKNENGNFVPRAWELNEYRRLSIHSNCLSFICSKPHSYRTRSFVCFSKDEFILPQENIPDILTAFKLVRVLDVKPIKFSKINSDMFLLVHLRYIALSFDMSTLPPKFSELWNIQTLIVDTTSRTLDVQANIWKLSQLRHFKTNASAKLPNPTKDSKHGEELQTLSTISVESCTAELFDRVCNLKKLGIRGRLALLLEGNTESFDSLGRMEYLEKLNLINDVFPQPPSEGQLRGLPQHYQFPIRLRSLTLQATFLSWNFMSMLGLLDNLEVLKLKYKAFTGKTWSTLDGGFRKLVHLYVEYTDLVIWNAESHHFPRLRGLVLKNCEKLCEIPIGLGEITSFQLLELFVSPSAAASAMKIRMLKEEKQAAEFKLSIFPPIIHRS